MSMMSKLSVIFFVTLLLGLFTLPVGAVSAGKIVLKYANFPPAPTFPCVQMERWKRVVEEKTGGRVEIKTFPGSTLLGAKNMMDGVIDGISEIGCVVLPYQPGRFPLMAGVDLPVGFTNSKVANMVLYDLFKKYNPASLKDVKVLTLFTAPPADIMSMKPIRTLEDLKGYELRCTGAGVKPLTLLGAKPVAMPMSETPSALQKGIVKGIFSSLEILKDFKFADYCKYATVCHMQTATFAVVMNKKAWDKLPTDVKEAMESISREHSFWTGKYVDDHVNEAVEWAKKEKGLTLIKLPKGEYELWHKKVRPIIDEWVKETEKKGLPARAFLKDLESLKEKYEKEYGAI